MVSQIEEILKYSSNVGMKLPVRVIPCYSQGKREDIDLAIRNEKEAQDPCIKIVVGTNLLESSLTVVDVQWIVDTGREKRIDLIGNRSHLGECFISKNSADQRKGRTGRTIEGSVCYRMYTEEHYKRLEDYRPLEIRRTPICDVVIELSAIGLDPVKVISELDHDKLRDAKKVLAEIGCIILNEPKEQLGAFDYDLHGKPINPPKGAAVIVTEVGHFVSMMPMDVRNAAALYYYLSGLKEGQWNIEPHFNDVNLFWALAAIVIIDLYGPPSLFFPRRTKGERPIEYKMRIDEHKQEFFSEFIQGDPLSSLLIAFKKCLDEGDGLNISFKTMKKWCKDNSCNNKKMRETVVQMKRMQKLLFSLNDECLCEYEKIDDEVLKMMPKLTQCLHRAYSGILLTNHYHSMIAVDGRIVQLDTMKTLSTHNIISTNYIPLSEIQIKDAKGRITILISLWLPLDIKPLLVIEPFKIQTISINVDQEESSE
jgi:HrpA-like RNA helicase